MSSVLEQPRCGERLTDDEWFPGDVGTTASHTEAMRDSLPGSRTATMYYRDGVIVVECDRRPPRWLSDALGALIQLTRLPENWDSYGAARVRKSSVVPVIGLLLHVMRDDTPLPSFVPTNRGNILMEWHTRGVDLEVEAMGNGVCHVFFEDMHHGDEWEGDIRSDLKKLVDCIRRLSAAS
jgi:hypothetical protein